MCKKQQENLGPFTLIYYAFLIIYTSINERQRNYTKFGVII